MNRHEPLRAHFDTTSGLSIGLFELANRDFSFIAIRKRLIGQCMWMDRWWQLSGLRGCQMLDGFVNKLNFGEPDEPTDTNKSSI